MMPRLLSRGAWRFAKYITVLCLVLAVAIAAGIPLYVRPQIDSLHRADAVMVLGGYASERYAFASNLVGAGWAPIVIASMSEDAKDLYCKEPEARRLCFVPDPPTTLGEGRELKRLAAERGWRTVIVVTFRPHISRARYILERCFGGDLIMVESPAKISVARWVYEYAYQTAGFIRAQFESGC